MLARSTQGRAGDLSGPCYDPSPRSWSKSSTRSMPPTFPFSCHLTHSYPFSLGRIHPRHAPRPPSRHPHHPPSSSHNLRRDPPSVRTRSASAQPHEWATVRAQHARLGARVRRRVRARRLPARSARRAWARDRAPGLVEPRRQRERLAGPGTGTRDAR